MARSSKSGRGRKSERGRAARRHYRLPTGDLTPSASRYIKAWRALAEPFYEMALVPVGYDPGLLLQHEGDGHIVEVSTEVALFVKRLHDEALLSRS